MMQKMWGLDKIVRFNAELVLLTLVILDRIGPWEWLGLLPALTAVVGVCLLYSLLGIHSCRVSK